jgi:hypothetical protein
MDHTMLKRALVALLVIFLHYVPQITAWMHQGERYCDWWSLAEPAKILVGLVLLTAAALGLDALVRRCRWAGWKRLFNHVFLLALASGLLAAFPAFTDEYPQAVRCLWIVALLAILGSLCWRRSPLVRLATVFCLVLSPLPAILLLPMLTWRSWWEAPEPWPTAQTARAEEKPPAGTPVFLFVFDEWSWLRSTQEGEFLPRFVHIRALGRQAVVFRQAISPHRDTMQSLPRFIYQTGATFAIEQEDARFYDGDAVVPSRQFPSLFRWAHERGYNSCLLGWYHPYRHVLGDQVDCCRSYFSGAEAGWPEQIADALLENSRNWSDPLSRKFGPPLLDRLDTKNWYRMGLRYRADMLYALAQPAGKRLVMCHVPAPHAPYIFNPDGSFHGPDRGMSDTEGYLRQLGYVDTLIGQIVSTLRQSGSFDRALLIFTSDHGWRFDPDPAFQQVPDWNRRIPLIVKLPGQHEPRRIDQRVCTNRLKPLLEAVFDGETDRQRLLERAALAKLPEKMGVAGNLEKGEIGDLEAK